MHIFGQGINRIILQKVIESDMLIIYEIFILPF